MEICKLALIQNVEALDCVRCQTRDMCLAVVKHCGFVLEYVKRVNRRNLFSGCETKWVVLCQNPYAEKYVNIVILSGKCAICLLDDFDYKTKCHHVFHRDCLLE